MSVNDIVGLIVSSLGGGVGSLDEGGGSGLVYLRKGLVVSVGLKK